MTLPISAKRLAGNAGSAVLQVVVSGLTLFLIYKYLLIQLGAEAIGVWSILSASTSLARISDLGLTGGVTKFVAEDRANGLDLEAVKTVQTAAVTVAIVFLVVCVSVAPVLRYVLAWALPSSQLVVATSALPFALAGLWINCIATVFLAGIDGCQKATHRNGALIATQVLFFCAVLIAAPRFGLVGVVVCQLMQSAMTLILAVWLLRKSLPGMPVVPHRWFYPTFKRSLAYAANFQLITICVLLFEPLTRLLMGRFGGMSMTAYYDMANQLVSKVRALMVSANQVIVPVVAETNARGDVAAVARIYEKNSTLMLLVAVPVYAALALVMPLISLLWVGKVEPQFVGFAYLIVAAGLINTISVPAYFCNLGTGHIQTNSLSHISMSAANGVLGFAMGTLLGGLGVAIAASISVVLGSAFVFISTNRRLSIGTVVPVEHKALVLVLVVAGVFGAALMQMTLKYQQSVPLATLAALTVFGLLGGLMFKASAPVLMKRVWSMLGRP